MSRRPDAPGRVAMRRYRAPTIQGSDHGPAIIVVGAETHNRLYLHRMHGTRTGQTPPQGQRLDALHCPGGILRDSTGWHQTPPSPPRYLKKKARRTPLAPSPPPDRIAAAVAVRRATTSPHKAKSGIKFIVRLRHEGIHNDAARVVHRTTLATSASTAPSKWYSGASVARRSRSTCRRNQYGSARVSWYAACVCVGTATAGAGRAGGSAGG